jgi:hypothetical protein
MESRGNGREIVMGFDASYQAIPTECGRLERARADEPFGELLACFVLWIDQSDNRSKQRGLPSDAADELWQFAHQLVGEVPDLPTRHLSLFRTWDKLDYLLSAERREQPATATDRLLCRAVRGGDVIADHVRAGQGAPLRYLPPSEVREVARVLERFTERDRRVHLEPEVMESVGIDKFRCETAEEDWPGLVEKFWALRSFYLRVAEYDEGVLFLLD